MRKIQYKFITKEVVEIEVDDTLAAIIQGMEDEEANVNRAEERRHESFEEMEAQGVQFSASTDVVAAVEQFMLHEKLFHALAKLEPQQLRLLHMVYRERRSLADIAREEGVTRQSIHERMQRIIAKLTKFLS